MCGEPMANPVLPVMRSLLIERPARKQSYAQLAQALEADAGPLVARFAAAADTPRNRHQLRHIIGLERWGQRRLRTALGEPPVSDEMDDYMPERGLSLADLSVAFAATRRETVVLARQLEARGIDGAQQVAHNQFGPLTLRGWLRYLNLHARLEGRRVR